jgi:ArsR family transcriptional regulator
MDIDILEQEVNLLHARVCSALGDPKRILILYVLFEQGRYVNEIADILDIPQPTISRHLKVLRERGLVETERKGNAILYTVADKRIIEALDLMRGILSSKLNESANFMQALKDIQ